MNAISSIFGHSISVNVWFLILLIGFVLFVIFFELRNLQRRSEVVHEMIVILQLCKEVGIEDPINWVTVPSKDLNGETPADLVSNGFGRTVTDLLEQHQKERLKNRAP
jgi:hypothetical protein